MQKSKIYLLTGPVQSGKTTALIDCASSVNLGGFLTPDIKSLRKILDLDTKEYINFQTTDENETEVQEVGKFRFLNSGFIAGHRIIERAIVGQKPWIVLDEIGKLELRGKGFIESVFRLSRDETLETNVILVVRDYLVDEVKSVFNLQKAEIVKVDDLQHLPDF